MVDFSSAGFERLYYAFEESQGIITGATPTLANGGYGEAGELVGVQSLTINTPARSQVPIPGNDGRIHTYTFESSEAATAALVSGVFDVSLATYANGTKIFTDSTSGFTYRLRNSNALDETTLWLIVNAQAKSASSGSFGDSGYSVDFFRATIRATGRTEWSGQTDASYLYDVTIEAFERTPWGKLLSVADEGATTEQFGIDGGFAPAKMTLGRFAGDGAETQFILERDAISYASGWLQVWTDESDNYRELTYVAGVPAGDQFSYDSVTRQITLGVTLGVGESAYVRYLRT